MTVAIISSVLQVQERGSWWVRAVATVYAACPKV